jgi:phenylacetic acid degradation operon negative regulatory protein
VVVNARFTILALLGSQSELLGRRIWLSTLLRLLGSLGLGEGAARAQLQRMANAGWFAVERVGRRSRYHLSDALLEEVRSGDRRVLEGVPSPWDGCWTVVCYEIAEGRRAERDRLRANLQWFGFGPLAAGVWLSPHDHAAELAAVRTRLGLDGSVHIATGATFPQQELAGLVARCWDLEDIAARWAALGRRLPPAARSRRPVGDEAAFVEDFGLLTGLLHVLRVDPNLPAELLPANWAGTAIRRRCEARREGLRPAVVRHVRAAVRAVEAAA